MVKFIDAIVTKVTNLAIHPAIQDASWRPNRLFSKAPQPLTKQQHCPTLSIDSDTQKYSIHFGENRAFVDGKVVVYHDGAWYSSVPSKKNERALEFIKKEESNTESKWGKCLKTSLQWKIPGKSLEVITSFLQFSNQHFMVFEVETPTGISKTSHGEFSTPSVQFPAFANQSANTRILTLINRRFSNPINTIPKYTTAPVCLFDDEKNSVLISALQDFGTNIIARKGSLIKKYRHYGNRFECGPGGMTEEVPKGYTYAYIMVFEHGINKVYSTWGDLFHQYYGQEWKMRDPKQNLMNSHLGYFTDNGAYYYYKTLPGMSYDDTLKAINDYYTNEEPVPFAYYHLDSWWYPKAKKTGWLTSTIAKMTGGGKAGGTVIWDAEPKIWDRPLEQLSPSLDGKPLTAHGRWFDGDTDYLKRHPMIKEEGWAMPTTQEFWDEIMATANKYNITIYEQDWTENQYLHFTHLRSKIGAHRKWLEQMSIGAAKHNIGIQYCMATPAQWMEAINLPNVVNFRTTRDYHGFFDWRQFGLWFTQNSMLARAIGVWPFIDVVFSSGHKGTANDEAHPELKALFSALGGGPYAVGDPIGKVDSEVVFKVARKDGLLYKPDRPLSACDIVYIAHDTPYLATTEYSAGSMKWHFALTLNARPKEFSKEYKVKDLDITGEWVKYNWHSHTAKVVNENTTINFVPVENTYQYDVYAPILPNGTALIGDVTHFLTVNGQQFSKIVIDGNRMSFTLTGLTSEKNRIMLYTPSEPKSVEINGLPVDSLYFNKLIEIPVTFSKDMDKLISVTL